MARQSLAGARTKNMETRAQRGIALEREVGEAIEDLGGGKYLVPSARTSEGYEVDLEKGTCTCVDAPRARRLGESCKHQVAAEIRCGKLRRAAATPAPSTPEVSAEQEAWIAQGAWVLERRGERGKLVTEAHVQAVRRALEEEAMKRPHKRRLASQVAMLAIYDVDTSTRVSA